MVGEKSGTSLLGDDDPSTDTISDLPELPRPAPPSKIRASVTSLFSKFTTDGNAPQRTLAKSATLSFLPGHSRTEPLDDTINLSRRSSAPSLAEAKPRFLSATFSSTHASSIFLRDEKRMRQSHFMAPSFEADFAKCLQDLSETFHTPPKQPSAISEKSVRFGEVRIREYPIIPGKTPGGVKGVPFTLAWEHLSDSRVSFTKYEKAREGKRRTLDQLKMYSTYREGALRSLGFSRVDINRGIKAANIGRARRRHTLSNMSAFKTHERMEKLMRGIVHILTFGQRKRKERAYIRSCTEGPFAASQRLGLKVQKLV